MLYSVIIPTYNRPDFLKEALLSLMRQTCRKFELIVVNTGSPEHNKKITGYLENRKAAFPFRIVSMKNRGPSAARNKGSRIAKGDWLVFLDDDDRWKPVYLEELERFFRKHKVESVLTWLRNFNGEREFPGKKIRLDRPGQEFYLRNIGIIGSNLAIQKKRFDQLGGFDESLYVSEDKDILLRMKRGNVPIGILKKDLVLHRINEDSQISNPSAFTKMQFLGKKRFFEKYKREMNRKTRRILFGEVCVLAVPHTSFWPLKLYYFLSALFRRPRYLLVLFKALLTGGFRFFR